MRCPSCDFSNEASAEACSQCGTPLSRELRTAESIELEEVTVQFDDDIGFSAGATIEPAGEVQPPDDSDTAEPSASSEEKAPPPPKEEEIGDLIGDRYEIISQLGRRIMVVDHGVIDLVIVDGLFLRRGILCDRHECTADEE